MLGCKGDIADGTNDGFQEGIALGYKEGLGDGTFDGSRLGNDGNKEGSTIGTNEGDCDSPTPPTLRNPKISTYGDPLLVASQTPPFIG